MDYETETWISPARMRDSSIPWWRHSDWKTGRLQKNHSGLRANADRIPPKGRTVSLWRIAIVLWRAFVLPCCCCFLLCLSCLHIFLATNYLVFRWSRRGRVWFRCVRVVLASKLAKLHKKTVFWTFPSQQWQELEGIKQENDVYAGDFSYRMTIASHLIALPSHPIPSHPIFFFFLRHDGACMCPLPPSQRPLLFFCLFVGKGTQEKVQITLQTQIRLPCSLWPRCVL